MKSISSYISEALQVTTNFSNDDLKRMFGKCTRKTLSLSSVFTKFLSRIKKEYSISNKTDRGYLWNFFKDSLKASDLSKEDLKELHCSTSDELSAIIGDNLSLLNSIIHKEYLKANTNKLERELKKVKSSGEYDGLKYTPLEEYDPEEEYEPDEEDGEAYIIYYQYNPGDTESCRVYRVSGKTTNPNVKYNMNLHRMDWNLETHLGYYHGNTCKVEYYRKTDKESLKYTETPIEDEII